MKRSSKIVWMGTFILAMSAIGIALIELTGPRTLARAVAPNGVEMVLVQRFDLGGEPYNTRFMYRKPGEGERWQAFYYDHQDSYWRVAGFQMNTSTHQVVFFRNEKPVVTFDWERLVYVLHRRGTQEQAEPNFEMPKDWRPPGSIW